jgi:hypothetical protein
MSKDPAALLYIDTWLSSTAEMDADCRGWYINLLLHQYDKGSLPSDIEKLAQLAVVKFSEFERFKQVFEQVLKQKFEHSEDGRLKNPKADEVLRGRQKFTEKRSKSGKIGYVVKLAIECGYNQKQIELLKKDLYNDVIDLEQAKDKQVLKQKLKLYINEDVNEDLDITEVDVNKEKDFDIFWKLYDYNVGLRQVQQEWTSILKEMPNEIPKILEHVPKYVKAKPDKKYRKKPENYLKERVWMDEIVDPNKPKEEDSDRYFWKKNWHGNMVKIDRHAL